MKRTTSPGASLKRFRSGRPDAPLALLQRVRSVSQRTMLSRRARVLFPCILVAACGAADAGTDATHLTVRVAVASNFADAEASLAAAFRAGTGHAVVTSTGATGQLYSAIRNGAPYDVFLAADSERPALLERDGDAVPGSRFTYAVGRLALYGPGLDPVLPEAVDIEDAGNRRIAIANPALAPYGRAASQALERLGYTDRVASRLVLGENIAQTYQFVRSGAAELGFVAFSQIRGERPGRYWLVPSTYHDAIRQEAVLLRRGADNPAALAFMAFLRGDVARRIIENFGYDVAP